MTKFFAIIVEDTGDENGRLYAHARKLMADARVELPEGCDILSCVEISPEAVNQVLSDDCLSGDPVYAQD